MAPVAVTDESDRQVVTLNDEVCSTGRPAGLPAKRKAYSAVDVPDNSPVTKLRKRLQDLLSSPFPQRAIDSRRSKYPACTSSRVNLRVPPLTESPSLPTVHAPELVAERVPPLTESPSLPTLHAPELVAERTSCAVLPVPAASPCLPTTDTSACVALDCEFVGIAGGANALGRCSIVDIDGNVLLDIYSRPDVPIVDYRTPWSGLTPRHMINALPFDFAQQKVKNLIKNKTVIGHAVHNDFRVLDIRHPPHLIRDTSTSTILNQLANIHRGPTSLKRLSQILLNRSIQRGSHCSVEDARATMALYRLAMHDWEKSLQLKKPRVSLPADKQEDEKSYLEDEFWPGDLSFDTR